MEPSRSAESHKGFHFHPHRLTHTVAHSHSRDVVAVDAGDDAVALLAVHEHAADHFGARDAAISWQQENWRVVKNK